jgi:hypothetical protein
MLKVATTLLIFLATAQSHSIAGFSSGWLSGDLNSSAVYDKGNPSSSNNPGARYGAASWVDAVGNLWLFGGLVDQNIYKNDLWTYSVSANEWTWKSGNSTNNTAGDYSNNGYPGARGYSSAFYDSVNNELYLFGGTNGDFFNDLWKYTIQNNSWTWVGGDNTVNSNGVYGNKGVEDPTNNPSSRFSASSWVSNGSFWLYGGNGYSSTGIFTGDLSDLWMRNLSSGNWVWVFGASFRNEAPSFGIKGKSNSTNTPGSLSQATSWTDDSGNLWLFGGARGSDRNNALWKFSISTYQWTWVKGDNLPNTAGSYGAKGKTVSSNLPPSRSSASSSYYLWHEKRKFVLFGGYTSTNASGMLIEY